MTVDVVLGRADDQDRRRLVMAAEEQLDTDLAGVAFSVAFVTDTNGPDGALRV